MTDKVQKIREEVERMHNLLPVMDGNDISVNYADRICTTLEMYIDSLQEEPVSESLNTESMIESYKQRLISQANGVKNNPLIDMCLASYKHGIDETLDTLNLSNVQRTVKDRKEEPVSDNIISVVDKQAKRLWNEINTGHEYSIIDSYNQFYGICMEIAESIKEEPVSEDLEEAAFDYAESCKYEGGDKLLCVEHFKAGAKWQKEQMMKDAIDAQVLENYDGKVIRYDETILDEKLSDCKVFDKVKVIIIKGN